MREDAPASVLTTSPYWRGALCSAVGVWVCLASTAADAAECLYAVSATNRIAVIETQGRNVLGVYPVSTQYAYDIVVARNRAFIAADGPFPGTGPGTVAIVDLTSGAEVAALTVGTSPYAIVATHDQSTVYVNGFGSQRGISVLDVAEAAVRHTIAVGTPSLALSPDGSALYAITGTTRITEVAVIEAGHVTDRINLQEGLSVAAYYPQASGDLLLLGAAGHILALDLAERRVVFTIDGTGIANTMAVDPRQGRVYWGTRANGQVGVADIATHEIIRFIDLCPAFACIEFTVGDIAVSDDGRFAYTTSVQGVSVVDLERLALAEPIAMPPEAGRARGLTVADCPAGIPIPSPLPTPTPTPPIACDPRWVACNRLWFTCEADSDCIVSDGLDCCTCNMGGGPQVAINRGRQSEVDLLRRFLCEGVACLAVVTCFETREAVCREGLCAFEEDVAPTASVSPTRTPTPTPKPIPCPGDCNLDGTVTVDDIVTMVEVAFGNALLETCRDGDANADGAISVDEILAAVQRAMVGCGRDCRESGCPLGTTCGCCCGQWVCAPPLTICCALACDD